MTATWDLRVDLPEEWFSVPLGPEADLDELERQLVARAERDPAAAEVRSELRTMLVGCAASARARGADSTAVRWEPDELDGFSSATLDTFLLARPPGPVADELDRLQMVVATRRNGDFDQPAVEICALPVGDAVRVQVITEVPPEVDASPREGTLLVETVQYWLPIADHGDVVLFAFATPNLAGAEALVGEFDEVVRRLELVR